ncbi:MAG TPA: hypothetical protein VFV74_06895 [Burkholderiales bacterium]|nr:hypothetical protein [Burkholderiales bacterium]
MTKLAASLSILAIAGLAGCAHEDRVTPATAPVLVPPSTTVVVPPQSSVTVPQAAVPVPGTVVVAPAPAPLQAGMGTIDTIVPVPASASAGGTASAPSRRVGIRMDSGVVQYVETTAQGLSIGERVQITPEGYMRRVGG